MMRKIGTRIISLFLIVTMLVSADVYSVFAENSETGENTEGIISHSGIDGDLEWSIDENGVLRISGVGDYEDGAWLEYSDDIISAIVDVSGLTSTRRMFEWCLNLESIDLSNLETQNVTDMSGMFYECESLTNIDVSGFSTENVTDMSYMFYKCVDLINVDVSNFNTGNVVDMSYMFTDCKRLSDIGESNFNTENVVDMSAMFANCNRLRSINVSNFNTENVVDMSHMFGGCVDLVNIDVSNFNTGNVVDMSFMFRGCMQLSNIDVSNFDTQKVTDMSYMFADCSSSSNINVSNFDTQNVQHMSSMFSMSGIRSIDVSNFNTENVLDMSGMFSGCLELSNIDVSNFDTRNVIDMSNMFHWINISSIDISNFDTQNVVFMDDMFSDCYNLVCISVPQNLPETIDLPLDDGCVFWNWWNENNEICTEIAAGLSKPMTYTRALEGETPGETTDPEVSGLMLTSAIYKYGTKSINLLSTAHSIETSHREFDLICTIADEKNATKYVLYSGDTKIAENKTGHFEKVNPSGFHSGEKVSVKVYGKNKVVANQLLLKINEEKDNLFVNSKLELGGEGVALMLDDDVPFIGGRNIDMNFPDIPINAVVEDGKIKIGLNIKKSELFSYNSNEGVITTRKKKSIKQKINDWKKKVKDMEYTRYKTDLINEDWKGYLENGNLEADMPLLSGKINFTAFGYAEGEWSDSPESISGELVVAISASATMQKQLVVLQIPVTVNCNTSWKVGGDATLKYDYINRKWSGDLGINANAAIEPYVGAGVGTWMSVGLYGQVKMGANATLITVLDSSKTPGIDNIYLCGEIGAKGYFAKKEVARVPLLSMKNLKNTDWGQYINDEDQFLIYSRTQNSVMNKKSAKNLPESLSDEMFAWSEENASVYMSPYVVDTGNRSVTFIENAYGAAEPQIITVGDTTLVVYLDNDESRALPNQTVVKYAVYNPVTGEFSEPKIVLDDDTADYKPRFYTDGTDIYVYYLDSTKVYGETDDPDITEYAGTFAVTVAKYDEDAGDFTKLGTISRGNHYCYSPILTNMGDSLFLAWAENGSNQVFGLTQDNSVNYSIYKDGEWCEPINVSAELNSITSIAIDGVDGQRKIAYCVDADNDLITTEQQLYISDESGIIIKCMEDTVSNLQYIQLPELEHKVLAFNQNGAVAYIENADSQPVELFEEQTMDSGSQFTVQGDKIYYLKTDENSRNVCCANYTEGQWGSVGLTDDSSYIDAFSVTDGMLVYLATDADLESSEDIQTSSNIKILSSIERHDLAINNVSFDELNMIAGEDLELEVDLTNNGTETVNNPIVTFYKEGDASSSQSVPISGSIHSGETVQENITVTAPEDFKDAVYSLKIEQTGVTDEKETDNVAEVDLSKTELDVSAEYRIEQGQKSLLVRVSNDSNVSSKADVSVSDSNGDVLYTEDNVDVPANDSVEISVLIEESLLRKNGDVIYTATVHADTEEYYLCNNTYEQRVWEIETWEPVVSDIRDEEEGNGEENPGTENTTTYTYKLNDDNTTITITKCTSSDTDIVIPSIIDGYTVTGIGDKAFQNVTSMKMVSFPSTLKSIGNYAFAGCTSLTTVILPDSLTDLYTYVFKGCTSLKSAKLNTGRINVTEGLFQGCTSLSSVTLPSSVQYIREYAFHECTSLKTLNLSKSLVTVFNNAFLSSGIKSIKYAGTSTNWKKITIYLTGNTSFLNATVTGTDGKTFSADSSKWNTVKPVKKPTVSKVKSFKAKAGKKKITLSWKKLSGAAGYQIQISTKKNFKGAKKISISKSKKIYTKKNLKAKKKYYIRIRAYKTYKDANKKTKKVYGKWTTINKKTK